MKNWIINIVVLVALLVTTALSVKGCRDTKAARDEAATNITALTDSVSYYKSITDEVVAEKTLLLTEYSNLKGVYDDLYQELVDMRVKNADMAVQVKTLIDNPKVEIRWKTDTITKPYNTILPFDVNNEFRHLSGKVGVTDNLISLDIDTDKVFFDYTLAIKDNKVFIHSSNPYVVYDDINGYELPKAKRNRWGIGAAAGIGVTYGLVGKTFDVGPTVALAITYAF